MSTIDNNIVSMTFDNASFEKKLADTIQSLDKLRQSLDFANSKKGLEDLGKATSSFNMGGIATHIESVSSKFLALATIGVTALTQITTAAINAGTRIASALTIDPIKQGFQEYETNMNSIQTILANTDSKGTTLDQVNAALDQLNTYSDQTIYNFAEMARNIGTFTAAGVDLDTSVNSIKGIANVAAISGSNSQQAATAMYQLSQAIATGSVKLMDWNSVVNAGMGGEVFQTALFETGKALGTIKDLPMDQTFTEWKDAGNSFRGSLESGWLTAEVLTNTLQGFTGDLTEAQIMALGYTGEQAKEIMRLGALGKAAATEVKTLTQLLSTVKESVASGWSASFRIIFGDFEEAKDLFTGINNAIGAFVSSSADARNALLQGWKDMGGRTLLIDSLSNAFYALGRILTPIKEAFRSVFPKTTSEELMNITQAFAGFVQKLIPSLDTIDKLKRGFQGFFYGIKIGVDILKGIGGVILDVIDALIPDSAGGGLLTFFADFGSSITKFYGTLLASQKIPEFFENLSLRLVTAAEAVRHFVEEFITGAKDFVSGFSGFSSFEGIIDGISAAFGRIADRWDDLFTAPDFSAMLGPFEGIFNSIKGVFEEIQDYISDWFSSLGDNMAAAAEEGDYSKVLDTLNVGLLAGITAILGKFMKDGIGVNVDLLGPGIVDKINTAFGTLTDTMKAMQTNIKAEALLKIAGAIALLTASVLVLSMIDSAALTKALAAMAVGFGQLVGSMLIITKMDMGPTSAAKMSLIAAGLIGLAAAVLVLSIAVKILSTMSWEEMAKGLLSVTVLLGLLSGAAKVLSANSAGLIRAGLAMIPLAIGINLLAVAMKIFATMSWEEIGKGLVGVGGALILIAGAMQLMPKTLPITAAGLVLVGGALNLIASSMLIFATMDWEEIGKGLVGVGGALLIIAGAMQLMPLTLPITAAGLVLVGIALGTIGAAMLIFGNMQWDEIGRGLVGMAGALAILAVATTAMTGSVTGAVALGIVTASLFGLVRVIEELSKLSIAELATGLIAMAAVIGVLAGASLLLSAAIIPMMGLGAALVLIGAGFALFGAGVSAVARGIQILAKAGKAGVEVFLASLEMMLTTLPKIAKALAESLLGFLEEFLGGLPVIVEQLGVIIAQILDTLTQLIPKFVELIGTLINSLLEYIIANAPLFVEAGMTIIMSLLEGINENIDEITQTVIDILLGFIETLTDNMDDIVAAGANLLAEFLRGIADNIGTVVTAVTEVITSFIGAIVQSYGEIITAGANAIIKFLEGIASNVLMVIDAGFQIVIDFLNGLADSIEKNRGELAAAGWNLLDAIFGGVLEKAVEVLSWFGSLPSAIATAIGEVVGYLVQKGRDFVIGLLHGVQAVGETVLTWFRNLPERLLRGLGNVITYLVQAGKDFLQGLWNGLIEKGKDVLDWLGDFAEDAIYKITHPWEMLSPSKRTRRIGGYFMEGLSLGIRDESKNTIQQVGTVAENIVNALAIDEKDITKRITNVISQIASAMQNMDNFDGPVITPILDLTGVEQDMKAIGGFINPTMVVSADVSYAQARVISTTQTEVDDNDISPNTGPSEVKFEQNIYAPTQLSTSDIYRQTRNQIVLAKEELSIP